MKNIFLILVVVSLAVGRVSSQAVDYYLDVNAMGEADGRSWQDAWTDTPGILWSMMAPGDVLWIKGGNYSGLKVSDVSGISIRIAEGSTEPAIFEGESPSELYKVSDIVLDGRVGNKQMFVVKGRSTAYEGGGSLFRLRHCTNVTLRGMELDRSHLKAMDMGPIIGISVSNSSAPPNDKILIEDCYVHDVTGDGININNKGPSTGFEQYVIRRVTIKRTNDDAIQHSGNASVHDCYFDKGGEGPLFGAHQDGIQTAIGGAYIKIFNNEIIGYNQCIFVERASGHVQIFNNVVRGDGATSGSQRGIVAGVQDLETFGGEFVVANNTMFNFLTFYGAQHGSLSKSNAEMYIGNNIFVNCKYICMGDSVLDETNIFWDLPGVQYYDTAGNAVAAPSNRGTGGARRVDPGLIDPLRGDFRLHPSSPAVGSGRSFNDYFTFDKSGGAREGTWSGGPLPVVRPPSGPTSLRIRQSP